MLQRQPLPTLFRTGDALGNEVHAIHPISYIGIQTVAGIDFLARIAGNHVGIGGGVNVGERFEERFGMAAGQARSLRRR